MQANRGHELVEQHGKLRLGQCKGHGKRRTQPGNAADRQSRRLIATLGVKEEELIELHGRLLTMAQEYELKNNKNWSPQVL